jgi:hypothetical protein
VHAAVRPPGETSRPTAWEQVTKLAELRNSWRMKDQFKWVAARLCVITTSSIRDQHRSQLRRFQPGSAAGEEAWGLANLYAEPRLGIVATASSQESRVPS